LRAPASGAATPLSEARAAERVAVAAVFRGDRARVADFGAGVPSLGSFWARLLCNAWTPRATAATVVSFERNDIS
jgi:hypothetical protein